MASKVKGYSKKPIWQWLLIYAVIGAVVYGIVYFFLLNKSQYSYTNTTSSIESPSSNTVTIANLKYAPASLTVKAGEKVTWLNNDSVSHTVTFDDSVFDSGVLGNGDSATYTFETPGTYTYHCTIHPSMKGTVVVK